jgi:hypothetical protein
VGNFIGKCKKRAILFRLTFKSAQEKTPDNSRVGGIKLILQGLHACIFCTCIGDKRSSADSLLMENK